jgi:hypothetical protein
MGTADGFLAVDAAAEAGREEWIEQAVMEKG